MRGMLVLCVVLVASPMAFEDTGLLLCHRPLRLEVCVKWLVPVQPPFRVQPPRQDSSAEPIEHTNVKGDYCPCE